MALYAGCAWFAIDDGGFLTGKLAGGGNDAFAFVWFLAWWPWALAHHVNPFFTHLVWQPAGLNLAWITSVPLLALLGAPVTQAFGPAVTFNVLNLAAPFLAACGAYALCLYVTAVPVAALLGGYLFGFSTYEMARASEQLNLEFIVFVPCLLLVVLARLDDRIGRWLAVFFTVLLLVGQFGVSIEIFATELLFGGFAWVVAFWKFPTRRTVLTRLVADGGIAAPIVLLILSPFLWAMFGLPHDVVLPPYWPVMFSTDPLNFVVPTTVTWFGGAFAWPVSGHFTGFPSEQSGYLGIPLLVILWLYLRRRGRFLGIVLAGIVLASLGPQLWFAGRQTHIPLPWAFLRHLPLIGDALPSRFMLYASLVAAIVTALWIAEAPAGRLRRIRLMTGALAALWLVPVPYPAEAIPYSAFFVPKRLQAVLGSNVRILIVPFGPMGASSFWQVENQFGFSQTGGYLGYPPGAVQADPIMRFYFGLDSPHFATDFRAFCLRTGTEFVVAGPGTTIHVMAQLRALSWPIRRVDDVTVFTVPVERNIEQH